MALNFDNEIPEWKNEGVEPSEELREKGFTGGYKPPATVFNWFWSKAQKCIAELQNKLKSHADSASNPHKVTKAQVGLGNVDNTSDVNKPISTAVQTALDDIEENLESLQNEINLHGNFYVGSCINYTMVDADIHLTIGLSNSNINIGNRDLILVYFNPTNWNSGSDMVTGVTIKNNYYPWTSRTANSFYANEFKVPCMILISIYNNTVYLMN